MLEGNVAVHAIEVTRTTRFPLQNVIDYYGGKVRPPVSLSWCMAGGWGLYERSMSHTHVV